MRQTPKSEEGFQPCSFLAKQGCASWAEAGSCLFCTAMTVKVLPSVSQSTGGDIVSEDHCLCLYKIPTVAWSATPLPLAADNLVLLLLPELPMCCDALG